MSETPQSSQEDKDLVEYLKYLTTLSTGSIILQIAFLEKVFPHPKWKALLVASLLFFTLSIIASIVLYTTIVVPGLVDRTSFSGFFRDLTIRLWTLSVTWAGFLLGILALVIFALRNLLIL